MAKYVDFAKLKEEVSIEQVMDMLDLDLRKTGAQFRGECPACEGGDRSLVVTPAKEAFYCFSAKKGGDLISLVAHVRDLPVKEAASVIAERYCTSTSSEENGTSPEAKEAKGTQKLQPLSYLELAHEAVEALGVSEATCLHFEAGYAPKGIMRGRLAIPIHDLNGELIAYCGRAVKDDQKPMLIFPKGFDPAAYVFNLHRMEAGELYCTDDPLDVLLAFENGVENCIARLTRPNVVKLRRTA